VGIGKVLEELEGQAAKGRMSDGGKMAGRGRTIGCADAAPPIPPREKGKTRDKVAAAVGMGRTTYDSAKSVVAAAKDDPETFGPIVEEMDRTGNVSGAARKVKEIKEGKAVVEAKTESEDSDAEAKARGKALALANKSIECLMRIPKGHPYRNRGFQLVTDWIKANK